MLAGNCEGRIDAWLRHQKTSPAANSLIRQNLTFLKSESCVLVYIRPIKFCVMKNLGKVSKRPFQ